MEENDFYTFLKVLKKYKLCYQFKQSLKKSINDYRIYGYNSTWLALFARAFIQNKKSWVLEIKNILLDVHGMRITNREIIEKIIFLTLNPPLCSTTTHAMINEIYYMIKDLYYERKNFIHLKNY